MNKSKVICFLLIISIALSALCGCKDSTPPDDKPSSTSENTKVEPAEDIPLLKIYTDPSSESYQALSSNEIKTVSTEGTNKIRVVALQSGITVNLQLVRYIDIVSWFRAISEFNITDKTKKDNVYEFNCEIAETIPTYRIVAEYNNVMAEYYFQYDGKDNATEFELIGSKWKPNEISEDSPVLDLCFAYANQAVISNNNNFLNLGGNELWSCFANAVSISDYRINGNDTENIPLTQWIADSYLLALFPSYNGNYPEPFEPLVKYDPSSFDRYTVSPCYMGGEINDKLDKVENNPDGTLTVKVIVSLSTDDGSGKYIDHGKAVLVKPLDAYNDDYPFGYTILGVSDYEVGQ